MKRLYIYVEGQTEESFVNLQLREYLINKFSKQISTVVPLLIPNKKGSYLRKHKGGYNPRTGYSIMMDFMTRKIKQDPTALYSTMFDYYAFPSDCPVLEISKAETDIYRKAQIIEENMKQDVMNRIYSFVEFVPYIQMHEFEALLFSGVQTFKISLGVTEDQLNALIQIQESYNTPEHINDSTETAPSKRLEGIIPGYQKTLDGINTVTLMTIHEIRGKCVHFDQWLKLLENTIKN